MRTITALAALALIGGTAAAATLSVPGGYPTIQAALAVARDGDTIQVSGGPYSNLVAVKGFTGLTLRASKDVRILANGDASCLTIKGSTGVTVEGFEFRGASGDGVVVSDSSGISLSGCLISDSGASGLLLVNTTRAAVTGCTIRSAGGSGIRATTLCERITVAKCLIEDAGAIGIGLAFEGFGSGAPDSTITRNRVRRTGGKGIVAGGPGLVIEKNVVEQARGEGIATDSWVYTSGARIAGNTVLHSGEHGISINGDGNDVSKNRVNDSGFSGILCTGSGHRIEGNQVAGALEHGLYVATTDCDLLKNRISDTALAGLRVGGGLNNRFTGNSVTGAPIGFIVDGTSNTFTGNKTRDCSTHDLQDNYGVGSNTYVRIERQFPNSYFPPPP